MQTTLQKHFDLFGFFMKLFFYPLKKSGLIEKINQKTYDLTFNHQHFFYENLPVQLDGLKILHLSDLHLDESDTDLEEFKKLLPKHYDFAVITGDFFSYGKRLIGQKRLDTLLDLLDKKAQTIAVLGNHDHSSLVDWLELRNVITLTNQKVTFDFKGQPISFYGTDDPHYFYTPDSSKLLRETCPHFSVALVHSPELYDCAYSGGHDLYLCGHTHSGQLTLVPGKPIVKRIMRGRHLASGKWKHGKMQGYTHSGIGTTTLPLRINTYAEIALHELKQKV